MAIGSCIPIIIICLPLLPRQSQPVGLEEEGIILGVRRRRLLRLEVDGMGKVVLRCLMMRRWERAGLSFMTEVGAARELGRQVLEE